MAVRDALDSGGVLRAAVAVAVPVLSAALVLALGQAIAPSTVVGPSESCTIFYDPDPAAGFSWPVALHEIMHCLGFNDITNLVNGPFQRCDADPDVNGDGSGDFRYMPEPSIMSYCDNPWELTPADVRGLHNAGY